MSKGLPVIEIFGPTVAGEGSIAGQQTHFVRFGFCTYRCKWCDSMHAVLPEEVMARATWLSEADIADRVAMLDNNREVRTSWVSLSGGNPAMHDLRNLVVDLKNRGYLVNIETQGDLHPDWLRLCNEVTVSPKPPSSGMTDKLKPDVLEGLMRMPQSLLKIVVFDEDDLAWATSIGEMFPDKPLYLSVGTDPSDSRETLGERFRWLAEEVLNHTALGRASVLPQLHVMAWLHAQEV